MYIYVYTRWRGKYSSVICRALDENNQKLVFSKSINTLQIDFESNTNQRGLLPGCLCINEKYIYVRNVQSKIFYV